MELHFMPWALSVDAASTWRGMGIEPVLLMTVACKDGIGVLRSLTKAGADFSRIVVLNLNNPEARDVQSNEIFINDVRAKANCMIEMPRLGKLALHMSEKSATLDALAADKSESDWNRQRAVVMLREIKDMWSPARGFLP